MPTAETIPGKKRSGSCSAQEHNAGRWTGILLLIIGGAALAKNFLVPLPASVFNWQTLLIVIGIFIGVRNNFRGSAWLILIIVGSAFLLNDFYFIGNLHKHVWPLVLIAVGAVFIFRPRHSNRGHEQENPPV